MGSTPFRQNAIDAGRGIARRSQQRIVGEVGFMRERCPSAPRSLRSSFSRKRQARAA